MLLNSTWNLEEYIKRVMINIRKVQVDIIDKYSYAYKSSLRSSSVKTEN